VIKDRFLKKTGPIRITYDTEEIRTLISIDTYIYVERVLGIVHDYFWDLLWVNRI